MGGAACMNLIVTPAKAEAHLANYPETGPRLRGSDDAIERLSAAMEKA